MHFFRVCLHAIKYELKKMLNHSLKKKKMGGCTNSFLLSLIPKETNPTLFARFQHISLCYSAYKIITKIMAKMLKKILLEIIFENQGGFMKKMTNCG
jgi:hypothetical protein